MAAETKCRFDGLNPINGGAFGAPSCHGLVGVEAVTVPLESVWRKSNELTESKNDVNCLWTEKRERK